MAVFNQKCISVQECLPGRLLFTLCKHDTDNAILTQESILGGILWFLLVFGLKKNGDIRIGPFV